MKVIWSVVVCLVCGGLAFAGDKPASPENSKSATEAARQDTTVSRSVVCTAISDREPVGALEEGQPAEFNADVGKVYFWTEVKTNAAPTAVRHVWYLDGEEVAEIDLNVKFERSRLWSSKNVGPGAWKVEAVTASGQVLKSTEFKVKN